MEIDQKVYIDNLLEEFNFDESNSVSHPGTQNELSKDGCPTKEEEITKMKLIPYRRAIGLLTYLSNTSRPDISYSVNLCAQFSHNPGSIHWKAVIQIMRYLCGTNNYSLCFNGNGNGNGKENLINNKNNNNTNNNTFLPSLVGYCDASWGSCRDSGRSTTGWIIKLGECFIDWNVHKQETVALSSCEAEYMAIVSITQAIMWTISMLKEIGIDFHPSVPSSVSFPIPIILSDNKSAIAMGKNDIMHNRSKHINIKHHFIRDEISKGTIILQWISTQDQIADIFTKTLQPRIFIKIRNLLLKFY
jgi:hypothetical protein